MPKPRRKENRGLPERWTSQHGAYYYRVPKGLEHLWDGKQMFRLGSTLPEAYKAWAARAERNDKSKTIAQLLDRYALEVIPAKSPKTQASNNIALPSLRKVFGGMQIASIVPQLIYKYVDLRSQKTRNEKGKLVGGRIAALREIEVLSHAYTKAVEWGLVDRHPFKKEMRFEGEKPRDRYVEDWEIVECLALDSKRKKGSVLAIQAYVRLKLMTGMSQGDLLRLTMSNLKEDGIHIQRHKTANTTGKRTVYTWTPELEKAVEMAKASRPALSPFLFCTRAGKGYMNEETGTPTGWKSMWQRFMARVLEETKVEQPFTEHDLRAKAGSDAESLEHARALLSHADARTTDRIYRRKPEMVQPLKNRI